MPCYNPPLDWEKVVVKSIQELEKNGGFSIELILVNDGSTHRVSEEAISYLKANLPTMEYVNYSENRGKGYALRQGVAKAKQELMIYTDIDFPYMEASFLKVYQDLVLNFDVVAGHRGDAYYSKTPFFRKIISKTLRWSLKTFLRLPTDDSQCGIKGFNKTGAQVFLDTNIDRFLFDLEFIKLTSKRKLKFKKTEVILKPNVVFTKVSPLILAREFVNYIKILFRK